MKDLFCPYCAWHYQRTLARRYLTGYSVRDNLVFLRYALVPLLVMIVPVILIIVQLNLRFSSRPLEPGESATVRVVLNDPSVIDRGVVLEAPGGVRVETPGVRVPQLAEVAWRIRAERPGDYQLVIRAGDDTVKKELRVGESWGPTSSLRSSRLTDLLLYPGEPPLARSGAVKSVEITYRRLDLSIFGWSIDWLVCFFVLSIASGFAFRKVLGVEV